MTSHVSKYFNTSSTISTLYINSTPIRFKTFIGLSFKSFYIFNHIYYFIMKL